jgi:hypothetical protein
VYGDDGLSTIEEILYTKLQKEDFATEDLRPDNTAIGVEEVAAEEKGGFIDYSGLASGDNSGGGRGERAHRPLSWKIDDCFSDTV